jgi:leucyl aminopeptidase
MLANNYKPRRTIKLIGYAAEEVGLLGSKDIAASFKAKNANVVGVMQLDMTNYKGSPLDIYLYTDYAEQRTKSVCRKPDHHLSANPENRLRQMRLRLF